MPKRRKKKADRAPLVLTQGSLFAGNHFLTFAQPRTRKHTNSDNMEFQSLILQIGELEDVNRHERARYLEEAALHNSTKRELEKGTTLCAVRWLTPSVLAVQQELNVTRSEAEKLQENVASLEVKDGTNEKIITQLKQAVKDAKEGWFSACHGVHCQLCLFLLQKTHC